MQNKKHPLEQGAFVERLLEQKGRGGAGSVGQEEGNEENLMVIEKEIEKLYPQDREENEYRYIEPGA